MSLEAAIQMQARASGSECIAIELPRGDVSDRDYSCALDNAGRYWGGLIAAEGIEAGPWAVQPGQTAFNVLLFVSDLARALPLIAERLGWRGLAEARVGLLNEDGSWTLIHPSPRGAAFALVEEVRIFPPSYWALVDRAEALRKQTETLNAQIASGQRLSAEMAEINRRFDELKDFERLGLLAQGDFDARFASLQERIEAIQEGVRGDGGSTAEQPEANA